MTPSPRAIEALRMKQSVAYVSIKKIPTMLACVNPDGRIRGLLNHHGAGTGRSTASLVQFQNMRRSTINTDVAWSELVYGDVCKGISREALELCYGSPFEVLASSIRHFVDAGSPMLQADYAAIEGRIVCWLADQGDALDEYRNGVDRYKVMASVIYGVPVEKVNKHPQRFVGKIAVLACAYGMSAAKFEDSCWKMGRYKISSEDAAKAVKGFRRKHDKIVKLWYDYDGAMQKAILQKGTVVTSGKVSFLHTNVGGMPFLLLKLPSGRKLAYPKPRLVPSPRFEGKMEIQFWGQLVGTNWGWCKTYGGSIVENVCQAVAGDILMHGVNNCEQAGYQIHSLIHDEALAYKREGNTVEGFVKCLTDLPDWCQGLPIEAEGAEIPFYKK